MYNINEIFYSLIGEGMHTGTPATFIRLSGCNLNCPFCDTEDRINAELSLDQILKEVEKYPSKRVVITGGEPTLQDINTLASFLTDKGYYLHLETNGTRSFDASYFDWVAVSPKTRDLNTKAMTAANELKFLVDATKDWKSLVINTLAQYPLPALQRLYLMPVAKNHRIGDRTINDFIDKNMQEAINFCKENPIFSLCIQMHKVLNIK